MEPNKVLFQAMEKDKNYPEVILQHVLPGF
jgi:hypothetical protein